MALAGQLPARFVNEKGGYFSTPLDGEKQILRPMEIEDGAMPSGNSAALLLFDRLFALTAEETWRALGDRQADYLAGLSAEYPASRCTAMCALLLREHGTRETVCAAPAETLPEGLKAILGRYAPELTVLLKTPAREAALHEVAPFTRDMTAKDGKPTYYVCQDGHCSLPVTE